MLPSWCCSDCLFGTEISPGEPSINFATSNEPVIDPIGVLISAVYTRQANRVIQSIPRSCAFMLPTLSVIPLTMLFHHKHHYHGPSSSSSLYKCLISPPNLAMTTELQRQLNRFMITYDGTFSTHRLTPPVHYGK